MSQDDQGPWYAVTNDRGVPFFGNHKWSLPRRDPGGAWIPGAWHELPPKQPVLTCQSGYHLTRDPVGGGWYKDAQARVFEAEYEGQASDIRGDQITVRRCRLTRELCSPADLLVVRVLTEGTHDTAAGAWVARSSARVEAHGSAHVVAYDSALIKARGSARVVAHDTARVRAWGFAHVVANGYATVDAHGSAIVDVRDCARVEACHHVSVVARGFASVEAHDAVVVRVVSGASATVFATDQSIVLQYSYSAQIKVRDQARRIDLVGPNTKVYRTKRRPQTPTRTE